MLTVTPVQSRAQRLRAASTILTGNPAPIVGGVLTSRVRDTSSYPTSCTAQGGDIDVVCFLDWRIGFEHRYQPRVGELLGHLSDQSPRCEIWGV